MANVPSMKSLVPTNEGNPAQAMVKVTKANADLPNKACRGLCVGTAGTANLLDQLGNQCDDFPLQQGYNPIRVKQVQLGGTADDIWALY